MNKEKFKETIVTATKALLLNKLRTFLTMLGVIIGVFAVVSLVSLVKGVQNFVQDQFETLGSNLLFVYPYILLLLHILLYRLLKLLLEQEV